MYPPLARRVHAEKARDHWLRRRLVDEAHHLPHDFWVGGLGDDHHHACVDVVLQKLEALHHHDAAHLLRDVRPSHAKALDTPRPILSKRTLTSWSPSQRLQRRQFYPSQRRSRTPVRPR